MMLHSLALRAPFLVLVAILFAASALAQTTNATLIGDVTDAQGGGIPGAAITVKNIGTQVTRTVETDAQGTYRVFPLNPGRYEVTASATGFKSSLRPNIVLEVASNLKVDFALEIGQVTEQIEVAASAPMLQTQDASVGRTIDTQELERLPVNGRNYTRLIVLMPGSSDISRSQNRGTLSGTQLVSVNGQRTQDNNFTIDSVDNNFQHMNSPGASPPMDSIHEFRVATNNSAEFGRSSGSNVNVVTKSGTRDLHGSVYEFFRNDKLDANDFFANRSGSGKVPYRQNQYGVAVGGPMVLPKVYNGRDKTFWFFSWEGFRSRRGSTLISTAPIEAQRRGDFSQQERVVYDPLTSTLLPNNTIGRQPFAGNQIPQNRISPAVTFLLDKVMPLPNRPGLLNNLVNSEGTSNDRDVFVGRLDHHFSDKDNVFFRYMNQSAGQGRPQANPNLFALERFDVRSFGIGWNHIFGPTSVFELKFGFNDPINPLNTLSRTIQREELLQQAGISMFQPDVLFSPLPSFQAVGEFTVGGGGGFIIEDTIPQFVANFTKVRNRHSFRMGYNFAPRRYSINASDPMNGTAVFDRRLTSQAGDALSGHSTATMLLGFPSEIRRGSGTVYPRARVFASQGYFQDDWRVTSKLTVNLGVRYEFANPPYDVDDQLGNLWIRRDSETGTYFGTLLRASENPLIDPATGQPNPPARREHFGRSLQISDRNNWAPRVGIAYQIASRTVVRAGFGVFYNSTFVQELQDKRKFWPYLPNQVFNPNTGTLPDLAITDAGPSFNSTEAIGGWPQNPENRTPYSQQWNLFVQHMIDDITVDIGYVGSANRKQIGYIPINAAASPGPAALQPRRLLPAFGSMAGGFNMFASNYHAFQAKAVKRYSSGLQFHANYTWGRCMDEQSSLAETKTQNPYNLRGDYSRCSYDLHHIFKLAYVYDLPFGKGRRFGSNWSALANGVLGGWSVEGIAQAQTGAPINVITGFDHANVDGRTLQRPDVIRDPNQNAPHTVDEWFDTKAFVLPAPYTFGNAGAFSVNDDGRHNWDLAIQKVFAFKESHSLQVRMEAFNFSNTVKMIPANSQGMVTFSSSAFGRVTAATPARQIQLGLRYRF